MVERVARYRLSACPKQKPPRNAGAFSFTDRFRPGPRIFENPCVSAFESASSPPLTYFAIGENGIFTCRNRFSNENLFWKWPDHHDHLAAFHFGHAFDLADLFGVFRHPFQQFAAQILVRHFAATKAQGYLDLVAIAQKLDHVAHFDVIIMYIGIGAEFDFLNLDDLLLFARLALTFLLFIFELAEIHDLTNGRIGIGRDLDQVKPGLVGQFHAARRADNANIVSICSNKPNFGGRDASIDAWPRIALRRGVVWSAGYNKVPYSVCMHIGAEVKGRFARFQANSCVFGPGMVKVPLQTDRP